MADACKRHDISDAAWKRLGPCLPGRKGTWGGNARYNRQFINAAFLMGAPWRDLPPSHGDWKNTHQRFCCWRDKGVWESLLEKLIDEPEFELLMIDASHVKVHAHGTEARRGNEDMAKTKGGSTPRYIWPWMRMVCRSEYLLQKVPPRIVRRMKRIEAGVLLADQGYDSETIVRKAEEAGMQVVIPPRKNRREQREY